MSNEPEIPDLGGLRLTDAAHTCTSTIITEQPPTNPPTISLDTSLASALPHLIHRLIQPLSTQVPHAKLLELKQILTDRLSAKYAATWDEKRPQNGSGTRSLICTLHTGLPVELREAAKAAGVDLEMWLKALALVKVSEAKEVSVKTEWEAWCDPGSVSWRYGGWQWEDVGYDVRRSSRGESEHVEFPSLGLCQDSIKIIWQAARPAPESSANGEAVANFTPARPSQAIPIRAPIVFAIPPTPTANPSGHTSSPSLLPAASIDHVRSHTSSGAFGQFSSPESDEEPPRKHERARTSGGYDENDRPPRLEFRREDRRGRRVAHAGSDSTSSVDSNLSDTNSGVSQLLTPGSRPGSADVFLSDMTKIAIGDETRIRGRTPSPNTPHVRERQHKTPATVTGATPAHTASTTPTITPYDGGNVTVLGGGVKLGGGSRPSSVMSANRTPMDRDRSPSISLASRALNSAIGPHTTGGMRKPRTRRRIMPTYLGSLHQPGVGGPINGVFSQFVRQPNQAYGGPGGPNVWAGQPQQQQQQQSVGVGMAPMRTAGQPRSLT
jgi:hypothetical protein